MGPSQRGHVERLAGNLLTLARLERDVSQRELAEAANVAESAIAEIESGARQPSLPELAHILAAIDQELRIQLAPYDTHDDIFDATQQRLSARRAGPPPRDPRPVHRATAPGRASETPVTQLRFVYGSKCERKPSSQSARA